MNPPSAALPAGLLPAPQFAAACEALPLVSIDLVLTDDAERLLLGLRRNAPARDWWFTPGGRIRKNEPLASARRRIAAEELGLPEIAVRRATLMGAWDHFYPDSAFDPGISTHYVNLALWLPLDPDEIAALTLPAGDGEQHAAWQWMPLRQAEHDAGVHAHVRAYAAWVNGERRLAGGLAG